MQPGEQEEAFSKESDSIQASQVALVVPCSGMMDTEACGIRAACDDEMVLKGCLGCSSNVQQGTSLPLFVGNTNTMGPVLGLGKNHC